MGTQYCLDHLDGETLLRQLKELVGRSNQITAHVLAHLAEVEARGVYREHACSSLYAYCIYELRLSEDEAQRRITAARAARRFPVIFEMIESAAIHLTGIVLLAPHLTDENHEDLLARARFRTKKEIQRLVAEIAPRPDVPARVEPLGPLGPRCGSGRATWSAFMEALSGPYRNIAPGNGRAEAPAAPDDRGVNFDEPARGAAGLDSAVPNVSVDSRLTGESPAPERVHVAAGPAGESPAPARVPEADMPAQTPPGQPLRFKVQFTAEQEYVDLLEEAQNLLFHELGHRDLAAVHLRAMRALVGDLRRRRCGSRRTQTDPGDRADSPAVSSADGAALDDGHSASADGEAAVRCAEEPVRSRKPDAGASGAADGERGRERRRHTRYVPRDVRRRVWERDEGRCAFVDHRGKRCEERSGLELHHREPFCRGGSATAENLALYCRAHNALAAERDLGREYVAQRKRFSPTAHAVK